MRVRPVAEARIEGSVVGTGSADLKEIHVEPVPFDDGLDHFVGRWGRWTVPVTEGRFSIGRLLAASYRIHAGVSTDQSFKWWAATAVVDVEAGQRLHLPPLRLSESIEVRGRVELASGEPAGGAAVDFLTQDGLPINNWVKADVDGSFVLAAPGNQSGRLVAFYSPAEAMCILEWDPARDDTPVVLTVNPGASLGFPLDEWGRGPVIEGSVQAGDLWIPVDWFAEFEPVNSGRIWGLPPGPLHLDLKIWTSEERSILVSETRQVYGGEEIIIEVGE